MSSLNELNLSFEPSASYFTTTLSLADLKTIRVVKITFWILDGHHEGVSAWLARLVESCSQILTQLVVSIRLIDDSSPEIDWEPLRNVVTSEKLPALVNFEVTVAPSAGTSDVHAHVLIKNIQNTLHRLHEQEILKCSVISTSG